MPDTTDATHALFTAIENGLDAMVYALVETGVDINRTFESGGWTRPPIIAAWNKHNEPLLRHLVEQGANVNIPDSEGDTVLSLAITDGNLDLIQFLLSHDARIDMARHDGRSVLDLAMMSSPTVQQYFTEALHLTRELKANATVIVARQGTDQPIARTTLGHLVAMGFFPGVKQLVEKEDGDPNARYAGGMTPLLEAAAAGHTRLLRYLHERGGDVNTADIDGWSPIFYAATRGDAKLTEYLVGVSANIDAEAKDGWTPLMVAANRGREEVVHILGKARAKRNHFSRDCNCELSAAWAFADIVNWLIKTGSDPNATEAKSGVRALFRTVGNGKRSYDAVRALIDGGADVNARTTYGQTALMISVACSEIVELLLTRGAKIDFKDKDGEDVWAYTRKPGADPKATEVLRAHSRP
jgi:ankyrin repeat protein